MEKQMQNNRKSTRKYGDAEVVVRCDAPGIWNEYRIYALGDQEEFLSASGPAIVIRTTANGRVATLAYSFDAPELWRMIGSMISCPRATVTSPHFQIIKE